MEIQRRQFLQGVLAAGVLVVGGGVATAQRAHGAVLGRTSSGLSSAEAWLLGTGRRALG